MKKIHGLFPFLLTFLIGLFGLTPAASAAFVSGSTGADGALEPTASIPIQIPESGVLNYTTINIPTGVTITFKKNTQNTPVTILATGDVTIAGTISLNGTNGINMVPGAGGPGGFGGGQGGAALQAGTRAEGPGGGSGGAPRMNDQYGSGGGDGGGFGTAGAEGEYGNSGVPNIGSAGGTYGNSKIIPLIGGSGGGGGGGTTQYTGAAGGGGGGSILIASSGTININGLISANGGNGTVGTNTFPGSGGGGSGGSIRLIANIISGTGNLSAAGGTGGAGGYGNGGGKGGNGRIRLEASTLLFTTLTTPSFSHDYPYAVTPPDMPTLTITSIGGLDVPAVPKGSFGAPDIMLPFNTANPITVVVTGVNIPVAQTVTLRAAPAVGNATTASGNLAGSTASSTVSIPLTISTAYPSVITASVTFEVAALGGGPIYAGGERVDKVRVSSNLGGGSTVTYITASGKEIVAKM